MTRPFLEWTGHGDLWMIDTTSNSEVRGDLSDDIMTTRKSDYVTNFWKAIAHDPRR